jgi:hypothetical protein
MNIVRVYTKLAQVGTVEYYYGCSRICMAKG